MFHGDTKVFLFFRVFYEKYRIVIKKLPDMTFFYRIVCSLSRYVVPRVNCAQYEESGNAGNTSSSRMGLPHTGGHNSPESTGYSLKIFTGQKYY
jgi:hypothetical protein